MVDEHGNLVFVEIKTEEDAQILRVLRNECKDFMTRSNKYITEDEQSLWFKNLDHNKYKLYLAISVFHGSIAVPVGFGILRLENDKVLLTGGLSEEYRGRGYGKAIFSFLIDESNRLFGKQIELEVLKTNTVAHGLYKKLGFVEIGANEKLITMEYRK